MVVVLIFCLCIFILILFVHPYLPIFVHCKLLLTSSIRLTRATTAIYRFIKDNRHMKLHALFATINVKLRGHYQYYGITFNFRGIKLFYEHVRYIFFKWLRRRGGKTKWIWDTFILLIEQWRPLMKPFISKSYALS